MTRLPGGEARGLLYDTRAATLSGNGWSGTLAPPLDLGSGAPVGLCAATVAQGIPRHGPGAVDIGRLRLHIDRFVIIQDRLLVLAQQFTHLSALIESVRVAGERSGHSKFAHRPVQ